MAPSFRVLIMLGTILASLDVSQPAAAHGTLGTAAATADGGLSACAANAGKPLYDCVARVLDNMGREIAGFPQDEKQTASALRSAAARLRGATSITQALSAILLCQAAIAGALRQARAISSNNSLFKGWGTPGGLERVSQVLARAASLIQTKG